MAKSTVAVKFTGDTSSLKGAVDDVDGKFSGLGGKMSGFGKVAAAGLAVGAGAAVAFGKSVIDAATESQKVSKQTEATLKSMGGQAGLTAKDVGTLANAIAAKTGIDDEAIQSGENLLLTFGNVRNEVGSGNDVFSRATKLATDMSVALGQDLSSSNIQLGKALNDPIKGITALSRVGVSFTAQQKDQVKAMVEAGDTLGAQKLILGEVEKQFKGSAEAQATAGEKLSVAWGNFQEQIGTALLPIVSKFADIMANTVLPALMSIGAWLGDHIPVLAAFGGVIGTVLVAAFVSWAATAGAAAAATLLAIAPVVAVTAAVAAVAAGIIYAYTHFEAFRDVVTTVSGAIGAVVDAVWPHIQQMITGVMDVIQGVISTVMAIIHGDWSGAWDGIQQIFTGAWEFITGYIGAPLELLQALISAGIDAVKALWSAGWDAVVSFVTALPGRIVGALSALAGMLGGVASAAMAAFLDKVTSVAGDTVKFVGGLPGKIIGAFGDAGKILYEVGKQIVTGLWDGMKAIWGNVTGWLGNAAGSLVGGVKSVLGIHSPSTVFAEIGMFLIMGLSQGMAQQWPKVQGQMADYTQQIQTQMAAAAAAAMPSPSAPDDYSKIDALQGDAYYQALALKHLSEGDATGFAIALDTQNGPGQSHEDQYRAIGNQILATPGGQQAAQQALIHIENLNVADPRDVTNELDWYARSKLTYVSDGP